MLILLLLVFLRDLIKFKYFFGLVLLSWFNLLIIFCLNFCFLYFCSLVYFLFNLKKEFCNKGLLGNLESSVVFLYKCFCIFVRLRLNYFLWVEVLCVDFLCRDSLVILLKILWILLVVLFIFCLLYLIDLFRKSWILFWIVGCKKVFWKLVIDSLFYL